jgi:hypothetical protein
VDRLQQLGIASGALLALIGLGIYAWKGARGVFRLLRKINRVLDEWIGDPATGQKGLIKRVANIETTQAAQTEALERHLDWHGNPGGAPANPVPLRQSNGPRRGRRNE